jgi:hypothetical protein
VQWEEEEEEEVMHLCDNSCYSRTHTQNSQSSDNEQKGGGREGEGERGQQCKEMDSLNISKSFTSNLKTGRKNQHRNHKLMQIEKERDKQLCVNRRLLVPFFLFLATAPPPSFLFFFYYPTV